MRQTLTLLLAIALSSPAGASTKDGIAYYNEGNDGAALAAFAAAAGQGSAEAKHILANLALMYQGHGVPLDDVQAYAWIDLPAHAGDPQAIKNRLQLLHLLDATQRMQARTLAAQYAARYGQQRAP